MSQIKVPIVLTRDAFVISAILCLLLLGLINANVEEKLGRCPSKGLIEISQCVDNLLDECATDVDCEGAAKCCSTGCKKACVLPDLSTCQRIQVEFQKRARALGLDVDTLAPPRCLPEGKFEPVQCNDTVCWCVDDSGFEMAGTRARALEQLDCKNPRPCAGFNCRMLCPYGFDLDYDGCPLCRCKDPCKGIKCPGAQACQLEEVPCEKEPCAPIPTCKQARSLDSLCPLGLPLTLAGGDKPYLCGTEAGKPDCPKDFNCHVSPGAEYGVCCAALDQMVKPGTCQISGPAECGVPCGSDLDCAGADKCCSSEGCGKTCMPPQNLTVCRQQQAFTELMNTHQLESKGYVPQCTADGKFEARQCSKNGLVCWCVDEHSGVMLRGSIGPAAGVHCNNFITAEKTFSTLVEKSRSDCGTNLCPRTCQYGYKTDPNGCQLCECEDPCMNFKCPNGFKCEKIKEEGCDGSRCPVKPDCKEVFVEPCSQGPYLTNDVTKEPIRCSVGSKFSCPSLYNCVLSIQHNATFCCPKREDDVTGRKNSDVMPTVCQVMKRLSETQGRDLANKGLSLSLMEPRCSPSGEFEPLQCDRESCWCVDEFGMEIPRTRGPKGVVKDCKRSRNDVDCEGSSMCRLGCDFGFVMDPNSNCPKCECRDPCETLNCPEDKICKIMTPSCEKGDCPRLPFCIDSNRRSSDIQEEEEEEGAFSSLSCPGDNYTGKIVTCKIRGRSMNCPTGFGCYSNTTVEGALGICCPVAADLPKKQGQCPFLVPTSTSCDISCVTDLDCEGSSKCCANGCGTQCTAPLLKTGCELERDIMSHRAKESGFPTNRVYLPKCDVNGKYEKIQCHPWTRICWCADNTGREIEKTRTPPGIKPTCDSDKQTDVCEVFKCKLNCPYGYALDTAGCPLCKCKNPCDKIRCGEKQICKMIQLNCTNDACPYLPICVPRKDKPCPYGNPLYDSTGVPSKCGPLGKGCPSSHKCLLDPFGEIAVCCPKPRETCAEEQDDGSSQCSSHTSRWYFNAKSNRCEQFSYTGCGGNLNNFESEQDCRTTCPVLTSCQKLREKNLRLIEKYKKIVFLPKCKEGGEFDSTQCLDELGLCWCVDKHGEAMKGTLTRGKPICSVRQARQHSLDREICEDGITAHVCDKSICDEKVCIADPSATCKINPCGGCKAEFYDARGSIVDCAAGLTTCQARIQEIINSPSWYRQDLEYSQNRDAELLPNFYTDVFNKQHSEMKEMNVDKPPRRKRQSFSSIDDDIFDLLALESYNEQSAPQVRTTTGEEFIGTIGSVDALSEFMIERPNLESTRYVNDAIKAGDCPAVRQPSLLRILAQMSNQCIDKCVSDADCPGPLRCCPGQCGDACQLPILPKAPVTKPGQCPIGPKACDDSLQKTNCRRDWDCPSTFKCCDNECGKVCIEPEDADSLPSKFFLVPPRCLESGQFSREQRQGELSWCMTADGVPIQGSLTRGFVRCAENGTVLERLSLGPICPSPDQAPKICTTECLHASCPGHKDAVCIADPCNGCRTAFYNSDGDEVSCEPICSQKIEKGMCRSSLQRWGFDPNSRQCEEFFYGGCGGNENNFDSLQKCQDTCKTIDRCSLPKNTGSCAKEAKRWFYNSGSQKCEEFIYTGCGGNANNFLTKEECEMTCPDLVMCPKLPNVNGEIPICSRSEVCEKEGCPDEDVVCTVDPCTCAPIFKNRKGKRVNCPFHSESGENYQSDVPIPNEIMRSGNMPLMKIIPAEVVTETAEEKMMRDKSKKIETEVIRMYNPAKEFVVRSDQKKIGKLTKQKKPKAMNLDVTAVMTRCKKMRQKMVEEKSSFVVDCDKQGRFAPTQCYMGTPSVCWCVDESGNQLKDTTMFMSGNRTCHYVPVKAVNVSLSIPMHDNHHPETNQIRKEIDFILNKLNVEIELYEPEMNHDEVRINFTLTGDNKIDAADYIEEMVRNGEFQVLMGDEIMPADYTSSKFVHVSGSPVLRQQRKLNFETLENREIIAEPLNKDIPYFAIILTMCIVSSFLILALIISLLLYRKKTTGEYPKGGGAPLAYGVHCRGKTEDIIPRGFPRVGLDDKEFQRSKPLSPVLPRFMKSGNTESMKL